MQPRFQHIVETRFSLRVSFGSDTFSREWLEYRLGLFRRFCLPSVGSQSAEDFTWLVFCDESTDTDTLEALSAHRQEVSQLRVAITGDTKPPRQIVRSMTLPETDVLITTRLDSDDAISSRYLEAVQAYLPAFGRGGLDELLVNFPQGFRLELASGSAYASRMYNTPFHSLFERPKRRPPTSVITGKHTTAHERHVTHQDESMPAWLQVLHGSNIHNKLVSTDRKLPDRQQLPGFPSAVL